MAETGNVYELSGSCTSSKSLEQVKLMQSVVIDHFEGDYAILFIAGSDESLSVLQDALPEGVKEDNYLRIELQDGPATHAERDEQATEEAQRRIPAKMDRLRRGEHLCRHDPE